MRRFLAVGCGGSGGSSLSYMMDQLRSELAAHAISRLPAGWQFVHVDVPTAPDANPDGLGDVRTQGGRYVGCGPQDGQYPVLDAALTSRLRSLDEVATWLPRKPNEVNIPVANGAGQYRGIGRAITLSRADSLAEEFAAAWQQLYRSETVREMHDLAGRVPGVGAFDAEDAPIVLVVSSMAGGAGASMALDVCTLLNLVPGVVPGLISIFMVSPDIFDGLPPASRMGVRANGLAMLGEIVACQAGAARAHDAATLSALGLAAGDVPPLPFGRVFPVGRFSGMDRTLFGDGAPSTVYRGLGRGLAALLMSEVATEQFVAYDLTNTAGLPANQDILGWGIENFDPMPWGAFGYACLSMGRDRYREYAAQRLARTAADQLVTGHIDPGNPAPGTEQVRALVQTQWNGARQELQLPGTIGDAFGWLTNQAFPSREVGRIAVALTAEHIGPFITSPGGMSVANWLPLVRPRLAERRAALVSAANERAYNWVFDWQENLADRTFSVVEQAIARLGLAYGRGLVDRLVEHLRDVVASGMHDIAAHAPSDVTAVPSEVEGVLGTIRGTIANAQQVMTTVVESYHRPVQIQIWAYAAQLIEQGVLSFTSEVLIPLRDAISEKLLLLERARDARFSTAVDTGLARLATDDYLAWPSDSDTMVPARFDHATNDVLLTSSADFDAQYRADLVGSVDAGHVLNAASSIAVGIAGEYDQARPLASRQVIAGRWATSGGAQPPGGLLERTAQWRSRVFAHVPGTTETRVPQAARFDVHVRPNEILARSRTFVARPGESFERFFNVSLRSFLEPGPTETDVEIADRQDKVVAAFRAALGIARPLTSVDAKTVQAVHGTQVEYRYKFSEVPFLGAAVETQLRAIMSGNPNIDSPSIDNFVRALVGAESEADRVNIFGSYANYSAVVFDSVVGPAATQWASVPPQGRATFWRWRRTRPLPAALPMGDLERRTMVAGWFLGQIVGQLRLPDPPDSRPVEIWDPTNRRWLPFPYPLLTPPGAFIAGYDWLPAVLESSLVAIAEAGQTPVTSSLRPYQLLRGLFDDHSQGPATGILSKSAHGTVGHWLRAGTVTDASSRVPTIAAASTAAERVVAAVKWLGDIRELAGVQYMAPGRDGAPGGGVFATVTTRVQAGRTPLFRDLAPDVYWATGELAAIIEAEGDAIARGVPRPSDGPPEGSDIVVPKIDGTF